MLDIWIRDYGGRTVEVRINVFGTEHNLGLLDAEEAEAVAAKFHEAWDKLESIRERENG